MSRYDVFLVNALADREKADLVVRRLRALKFKVRYDKKREHTTPTPKDYRDADASQTVLILWSKDACDTAQSDSDWVHAIAHHARSKDGVLLQSGLDRSVPDEPFSDDKRFALTGMGPRKLVNGYYDLIDELGRRDGRKDLRAWVDLKASDKDGKDAWKEDHPTDPLSQVAKPKGAVAPAAAVASAATIPEIVEIAITPPQVPKQTKDVLGPFMLGAVGIVILVMLIMSAAMGTKTGLPAVASVPGSQLVAQCPEGQMPSYLLEQETRRPLEPGPIIDDTEE